MSNAQEASRVTAAELIRAFDADCEAKGHYFKPNPVLPGFDYCEACGASRHSPKGEQNAK